MLDPERRRVSHELHSYAPSHRWMDEANVQGYTHTQAGSEPYLLILLLKVISVQPFTETLVRVKAGKPRKSLILTIESFATRSRQNGYFESSGSLMKENLDFPYFFGQ